jgi:5-methylthioadenosine/S-adenosylhomocysteine deaminase
MAKTVLIKGGTLLTMNARNEIVEADLLIEDDRIASIGVRGAKADATIDASGCAVLPGLVQTHVHLCQTLFRGAADDLPLIDWLKKRVWPLEAAHSAQSLRASARLGIAELVKGGTTCALTMETVNHTEAVFRAVEETGFRATVGKCMMDKGDDVPEALLEETANSVSESLRLLKEWNGRANGRIRYCFAPRFAISCTEELLQEVAALARLHEVIVHTHASENRTEIEMVKSETGRRNIEYLDSVGLTGTNVVLAHCVHLDASEMDLLARSGTHVAHCPSSNLKLGSGVAPVAELLERGISVSLGADGAPCNNRLDMFTEMRTAALLQKALRGPDAFPAGRTLRMATIDGARALGLETEIGSLEEGKKADLTIIDVKALHMTPRADLVSTVVYAATAADVRTVVVDGNLLLDDGHLTTLDEPSIIQDANEQGRALMTLAGLRYR